MAETTLTLSGGAVRNTLAMLLLLAATIVPGERAIAQAPQMGICKPIRERTQEVGCWIITNEVLGQLPKGEIFWHLSTYPTRQMAATARGPRGTVVEAFGKIWLFDIAEAGWRPSGGERIAQIGPLPVSSGTRYTAQYMESTFTPGMTAPSHQHPGPEIWFTLSGETCLETPEGKTVSRPGGPQVIIPAGLPMHLTAVGSEMRRSLVLVLHDSTQPAGIPQPDWTPKGLCKF
jgi:quercetin dioxygenase-like cupin family protein